MSQNTTATQPRTVQTADRGKLDVRALVLLAILLAAGFILNFTVGKAISGISGGMISPEFIISAFCLTILVVRPNIGQALVIGLISAAVIQIHHLAVRRFCRRGHRRHAHGRHRQRCCQGRPG